MTIQEYFLPRFEEKFPVEFAAQHEHERQINEWAQRCAWAVRTRIIQEIEKSLNGNSDSAVYFKNGKFSTWFSKETSTHINSNGKVVVTIANVEDIETDLDGTVENQEEVTAEMAKMLSEMGIVASDARSIRDMIWIAKF